MIRGILSAARDGLRCLTLSYGDASERTIQDGFYWVSGDADGSMRKTKFAEWDACLDQIWDTVASDHPSGEDRHFPSPVQSPWEGFGVGDWVVPYNPLIPVSSVSRRLEVSRQVEASWKALE